jgi:hypothetical protein
MKLDELKTRLHIYLGANKKPRPGCIESGAWETWQCCDFHRQSNKEYEELKESAIAVSLSLFPNGTLDETLLQVKGEYCWILSERWWEWVDQKIKDRRENQTWLEGLQPGDQVLTNYPDASSKPKLETVEKAFQKSYAKTDIWVQLEGYAAPIAASGFGNQIQRNLSLGFPLIDFPFSRINHP